MAPSAYDIGLDRNPANHQPLTPLQFLERSAAVFPDHPAVIHGALRRPYRDLYARSRRLASALARRGIGKGDTVSAMMANTPGMVECHYGIPMCKAVLNALNTRLDAAIIAFTLDHADSKVVIVDREFSKVMAEALKLAKVKPLVIDYDDPEYAGPGERLGAIDYEAFLAGGDPDYAWSMPDDEWDAISLNYTSGTTGDPKGVVYHHRGAYLLGIGNVLSARLGQHPIYLWTLPMFHCNGWCFPWTLSAVAGTHVCLRAVRASAMYELMAQHGVTHMCGAPIVMSTMLAASPSEKKPLSQTVQFITAGAPPPAAVLGQMKSAGFNVTHVYGLTEVYGPAVVNDWNSAWDALPDDEQASLKSRQGVRYLALENLDVLNPDTMQPVPADGQTLGEVMFRGNVVMKGYLKNKKVDGRRLRRRLVPFRRPRREICRRLHPAEGPFQGHHHFRRREHFVDRGRGRIVQASGGGAGGGGRPARRQVGRDALRLRRTEARRRGERGRVDRMVPDAAGAVQMPEERRLHGIAEDLDRQDPEVRAARAGEGVVTRISRARP